MRVLLLAVLFTFCDVSAAWAIEPKASLWIRHCLWSLKNTGYLPDIREEFTVSTAMPARQLLLGHDDEERHRPNSIASLRIEDLPVVREGILRQTFSYGGGFVKVRESTFVPGIPRAISDHFFSPDGSIQRQQDSEGWSPIDRKILGGFLSPHYIAELDQALKAQGDKDLLGYLGVLGKQVTTAVYDMRERRHMKVDELIDLYPKYRYRNITVEVTDEHGEILFTVRAINAPFGVKEYLKDGVLQREYGSFGPSFIAQHSSPDEWATFSEWLQAKGESGAIIHDPLVPRMLQVRNRELQLIPRAIPVRKIMDELHEHPSPDVIGVMAEEILSRQLVDLFGNPLFPRDRYEIYLEIDGVKYGAGNLIEWGNFHANKNLSPKLYIEAVLQMLVSLNNERFTPHFNQHAQRVVTYGNATSVRLHARFGFKKISEKSFWKENADGELEEMWALSATPQDIYDACMHLRMMEGQPERDEFDTLYQEYLQQVRPASQRYH